MKIALIGDIHGNADALEAVLTCASERGVDFYLITGDLVGYYYQPKRVVEIVRDLPGVAVRGNHEDMLFRCQTSATERALVRSKYGAGIDVALDILAESDLQWLRALPKSREIDLGGRTLLLAHGAPWDTDVYIYPDAASDVWARLADLDAEIIVLGHTHYQFDTEISKTMVINPGSVGQPRDRKPGAAWSLLDTRRMKVSHFRAQYDTQPLIEEARQRDPHLPYLQTVLTRR